MNQTAINLSGRTARTAALALSLALVLSAGRAWADTQYFYNGAKQDLTSGGWDFPNRGACFPNATLATRAECLAQRFNQASELLCVQASGLTPPQVYAWSTAVCNDTVNTTKVACEAQPGRLWNDWGGGTGVCAVTMKGYDRNRAVCTNLGGTWVNTTAGTCTGAWIMPDATTYTPALNSGSYAGSYVTGTTTAKSLPYPANPGPGEQCTRCHNSVTEWNVNRVRDVSTTFVNTGHQNKSRPVVAGQPWAFPNGGAIYPTDSSGNAIDWTLGTVTIGGVAKSLYWIHSGVLGTPLPGVIYNTNPDPLSGKPGVSYSCARCHTTGWTSDASLKAGKLPEKTWPGITWDGVTPAVAGQVNLAGGVAADTRTMASWDVWGIQCSRCHSTAAENTTGKCVLPAATQAACTTAGGSWWNSECVQTLTQAACTAASGTSWLLGPPYGGASYEPGSPLPVAGMSTHHSVLTSPDAGSGYCTDSRFTTKLGCLDANNYWPNAGYPGSPIGTWLTPCSDGVSTSQQACLVAGKTWLVPYCSVGSLSYCSTSTYDVTTCATNGGTWGIPPTGGTSSVCMLPMFTTATTCAAHVGWKDGLAVSTAWNNQFTDIDACKDASGKWTGSKTQKGPIIFSLCMTCHRQEASGYPYDNGTCSNPLYTDTGTCIKNGGTWTYTGGGLPMKVGPVHNTIAFGLHYHGNQLLNSPHGQFSGRFADIATSKFGSGYGSKFQNEGEALSAGNGCTGCHDVHKSVVEAANPAGGGVKECQECHSNPADINAPQIDLKYINHLGGPGTPLENVATDPASACITCHMPGGAHMFRINTDATYSTFPASAFAMTSGVVDANTAPEGSYTKAVWVDIDSACGQCHGGGATHNTTTGSITKASKTLTVANATGFVTGTAVTIAGAGSVGGLPVDFPTYVASVSGTTVTLVGAASTTVTNASVVTNPTKNGAPYYTKAQIALVAKGMHASGGVTFPTTFSMVVSGLSVTPTAVVTCGGLCPSFTYDWVWGDGTSTLGVTTATPPPHLYAAPGTYWISLVVKLLSNGLMVGSATRSVSLSAIDNPPVCTSIFTFDANTWTATLKDTSTDTDQTPVGSVMVDWGDNTLKSGGHQGDTFMHVYTKAGTFTITHTATDTKPQQSVELPKPVATVATFTISGFVMNKAGTIGLSGATVQLKKGTNFLMTVYTASDGSFSAALLKPGTYTITVTKTGYTFANPAATITIGPTSTGTIIKATAP